MKPLGISSGIRWCEVTNMCIPDFLSIVSIGLSAVAAGFSIWSFFAERNRTRSEATIHAFDELQTIVFCNDDLSLKVIKLEDAESYVQHHSENENLKLVEFKNQWDTITARLSLLEHFSVGINYHTYDLKVLNAMAGNLMIKIWDNLQPIVKHKRNQDDGKDNYKEFEKMVENIKHFRSRKVVKNRILGKGN